MKERSVVFSPEARQDLLNLHDWISKNASPAVALQYLERLEAYCRSMGLAAERGHRRDDIRPGLRIVGFERRTTIAFTVTKETVVILRLFHAGQAWEEVL